MEAIPESSERVRARFHEGNILRHVASLYSDPFDVVREAVQNALDERPKRIEVAVDLRRLEIAVRDDGRGMSREQMRERVESIGQSSKIGDPEAIGEKGIGLLAPLAIAEEVRLISMPRGARGQWHELLMRRSDLSGREVNFPISVHPGLSAEGRWSTLLQVRDVAKGAGKKLARMEDLADHLADAFDEALRREPRPTVVLHVTKQSQSGRWLTEEKKVEASEFPGRREQRTIDTRFGPVRFNLWLNREKATKPVFRVDHRRSSFLLRDLEQYAEVADAFDSGHIQGSVRVDFCTVRADRHGFEWDEEFDEFLEALRTVAQELRQWLTEFESTQRKERIEELAREVLTDLENWLREHPEHMPESLRALVSPSHVGADRKQAETRAVGRVREGRRSKRDVPPLGGTPIHEQKRRRHSVVVGSGARKQEAAGQRGLTIQFETATGEKWRSRCRNGVIIINDGHQDYAEAESKGQRFEKLYQSQLVWFECSSLAVSYAETRQMMFRQTFQDDYFPLTMSWRAR